MQPTTSTKCSQVICLLNYSLCQIEAKTCLGKSTIGRIKKEINVDKENSTKEAIPQSSPIMTNSPLFTKSPLQSLIMLYRLSISSTTPSPTLSHPRQSEMHSM